MRLGAFAVHDRSRAEFLLQLPHGGEMIRMGVGVDDEPHPQAAAVGQADITVGLSQRWIDDGRDAALFASYEIRSEEHTSELQSLMRISYAVFCLKKKTHTQTHKQRPI